jgi:RNA polymerase sigma-54 factor
MGISHRLEMRQGQSLVMTPQLLQAIKLLQLSHLELSAYVENELESNPLLERGESLAERGDSESTDREANEREADHAAQASDGDNLDFTGDAAPGLDSEWSSETIGGDRESLERGLGTELENVFPDDGPMLGQSAGDGADLGGSVWSGTGAGGSFEDEDGFDLDGSLVHELSLHDHLIAQLDLVVTDPGDQLIGRHIVDSIDAAGYFTDDLGELSERLGAPLERAERLLSIVQSFEPSGIGGRNLAECLAIQLRELDRYDPAMAAMLSRLDLVAKRDIAALRKLCGVDDEDIIDMFAEIKQLDPKPGRGFGNSPVQLLVPDVYVRPAPDGSWHIELNTQTLPRVLVNQAYYARVSRAAKNTQDKTFLTECLQNANWLTRSLEQRARTILKVASEIVRQQDAFFAYGVEHLRPINLKTIADAIGMHESTVSRVTANKSIGTNRGSFEMKYFFSASIAATEGGDAHSAESVRFRIKQMIDAEDVADVLSDDTIVKNLRSSGIEIARRTVAKYRESLRISSSVERRREKIGRLR